MDNIWAGWGLIPLTMQKITPGNTVTVVSSYLYRYKEYTIGYDSCDFTGGFLEGMVITGATSGAQGVVRSATITAGTILGGDAAGLIRFHSWNGTNFTNNEKLKVAADSDVCDIDGTAPTECTDNYEYRDWVAKCALVIAITNAQLVAFSGRKILGDQTQNLGVALAAQEKLWINDASAIKNINVVDAAAGTAGSSIIIGYF